MHTTFSSFFFLQSLNIMSDSLIACLIIGSLFVEFFVSKRSETFSSIIFIPFYASTSWFAGDMEDI